MADVIIKVFSKEALLLIPRSYRNILTGEITVVPLENETVTWGLYYNASNSVMSKLIEKIDVKR